LRATRDVKVTLATGIALMLVVGAVTLTGSPPQVIRVGVPNNTRLTFTTGDIAVCQANEVLPRGASAIRLSLVAGYGLNLRLMAYRGSQVLTQGKRGADWTSNTVTVPVKPVDRTVAGVRLCFALGPNSEPVYVAGTATPAREAALVVSGLALPTASAGSRLSGRVGVEYLASARGSWWSRILSVARHIGIGHVMSGTWVALLLAALMAAVGVLAVQITLWEL
jgi:hypothetical protein